MENRIVKVAIRHDMMDKAGELQRRLTGKGWENVQLPIKQLKNHIGNGFPFTHPVARGHRKTENFLGADILIADIDEGLTFDEAKVHPFITSHATFLYTTPSHTDTNHRFRVIFVLERPVVDSKYYKALYTSLTQEIPTDPNIKSCAQLFFGNRQAIFHWVGKSLPVDKINDMIRKGLEEQNYIRSSITAPSLTPDIQVNVKNKGLQSLTGLNYGTPIHCPFGTHQDKNPSAFVKVNSRGIRGVQCRSCDQSAWMESSAPNDDGVGYFHRKVLEFAGQASTSVLPIPQGLDRCFPDFENSLAESHYHLSNSSRFSLSKIVPGINLIKSAKGTGKTYVLSKLVEQSKDPLFRKKHRMGDGKGILIGHRQSLIQESAKKLGMECYLDTGDIDTRPRWSKSPPVGITTCKPQYYAICLDSLHSRIKTNCERYAMVIIDESEQVFSHFFSHHMEHPTRNFEILRDLIRSATFVYCLDADLDTITLAGICACLSFSQKEREGLR